MMRLKGDFLDAGVNMSLDNDNHVECACLLSKLHTKQNAESKATYEEIKEYVPEHTGLKVSSLYIGCVRVFPHDLTGNKLHSNWIIKVQRVLHDLEVRCICE